ncbi:hypothetical protein F5Y04DRAFT_260085 [Hypomontagnella monticulosa]|nr:hypothetical protein F5Y04DRAFT_260085 [Hypomontagnella monticulosa]
MPPPTVPADPQVLIIGAGVAGLTLAQGLRLRSIPFRVFERHPRAHASQGHRFRVSRAGLSALNDVLSPPLRDLLRRTAADTHPFAPRYVDVRRLEYAAPTLAQEGESMPVDRAWIRALMALGIEDAIEYEKEFAAYEIVGEQVLVRFKDGSEARGKLLVGADGIRSRVRAQLQPSRRLLDLERWVLWGRTPLTKELKKSLPPDLLSWCMYVDPEANVQVVVEPMIWSTSASRQSEARLPDFSDYVYWVVCTATSQFSESPPRTAEVKKQFLERATETWHPDLKQLFRAADHNLSASVAVLSSKPDIELPFTDQNGRVTLVGDAAHSMSPMGGSGGDTAVRNAADLARTLAEEGVTQESVAGFEARMAALARERIEHSFRGGQKFWRGKEWTEYTEAH